MDLSILCWNLRRAGKTSCAWEYFRDSDPEIALLQEVSSIPEDIQSRYTVIFHRASSRAGRLQSFGTAILCRTGEMNPLSLSTGESWIDEEVKRYEGNIVAAKVSIAGKQFNFVSVYSPAWPLDRSYITEENFQSIKLTQNPDLWLTELVWALVRKCDPERNWIIGGDFNSSETFDTLWKDGPRGNKEFLDRMKLAGLTELLGQNEGFNTNISESREKQKSSFICCAIGGVHFRRVPHLVNTN